MRPTGKKSEFIAAQGIHVVTKPIGPACNLDCASCFYPVKQALYAPVRTTGCRMQ